MENALWRGEKLIAFEVSKDYFQEKEIRRASQKGELSCPDPECKSKVLKYCHGEIKQPYFAHRDESDCDYQKYERTSGVFKRLRLALYEHFSMCDYPVEPEVKKLKHHYTHLYFEWEDGGKTAIEFGTRHTQLNEVEELNAEYKEAGIEPIWLVVDKSDKTIEEKHTYFLKRYCFNESVNKSLIVLDYDGKRVTQYKRVPMAKYKTDIGEYLVDFQRMFAYQGHISELVFENGSLNIQGFDEAYAGLMELRREKTDRFGQSLHARIEQERREDERRMTETRNAEMLRQSKQAEQREYIEWLKRKKKGNS